MDAPWICLNNVFHMCGFFFRFLSVSLVDHRRTLGAIGFCLESQNDDFTIYTSGLYKSKYTALIGQI